MTIASIINAAAPTSLVAIGRFQRGVLNSARSWAQQHTIPFTRVSSRSPLPDASPAMAIVGEEVDLDRLTPWLASLSLEVVLVCRSDGGKQATGLLRLLGGASTSRWHLYGPTEGLDMLVSQTALDRHRSMRALLGLPAGAADRAPISGTAAFGRTRTTELELQIEAGERRQALEAEPPRPAGHPSTCGPVSGLEAVGDMLIGAEWALTERQRRLDALRDQLSTTAALADDGLQPMRRVRPNVPLVIIVPVHNALCELTACFTALQRNTTLPARLMFVDDCSSDHRVSEALLDWLRFEGVEMLGNSVNVGFSGSVNRALRATQGYDVVILNSDTAVTPRWLERLTSTAYSDPLIATVTPISDNAGAFSVPRIAASNPLPAFLDHDHASRVIAQRGELVRPRTPTANGFCMYIKRQVIDQIGYFDAEVFPRGYGEENDFCMRAIEAGWRHVVDDSVYVHHVREASFGAHKQTLIEGGRAMVDARHPQYTARVREFVDGVEMAQVRTGVAQAFERTAEAYARDPDFTREVRPRILFVAHEGRGGTPATNVDLMHGLEAEYECWLLSSSASQLILSRLAEGTITEVDRWRLEKPILAGMFSRPDYSTIAAQILDRYAIELMHIRHLLKHTFDLPSLAAARGIPVVFSFHDYYLVCPTVHLLDSQLDYCAGSCTPGRGECGIPTEHLGTLQPLKHRFVYEWRTEVQRTLADVDAFVTTSPHAKEVHLSALPTLEGRPFEIIEHGRDCEPAAAAHTPQPGGPVRIAVPANLGLHKGAEFMRAMLEHDTSGRIRFHLLGDVPEQFSELGRNHGRYERDQLAARLAKIRPAFVGIFSIWAETYSHTLSEAWAAGVPVIATGLGALRERLEYHGGGWLIDPGDPRAAVELALDVADDPTTYERARAAARASNVRTVKEMAGDYSALYRRVLDRRRTFVPQQQLPGQRHLSHGVLRAEVIVLGDEGNYPASTHVRLLRRLYHPSIRRKLHATVQHGCELSAIPPGRDLVVLQRTAITPARVDGFLAMLAERSLPLVLDLDDDLFALGERHREYGDYLASLERLIAAASLVTVSTPILASRLAAAGARTLLLENMIDERLYFAGTLTEPAARRGAGEPLQVLYMGLPDHAEDLELLAPVFKQLRGAAQLTFASRFPTGHSDDWHRSLAVPPGRGAYPDFVRWLVAQRDRWDLAVAPLLDTPFNQAKSDLKFLEYAALGLPGVFSKLEPYASIDGDMGLLVDNDPDAWRDAIASLAEDPHKRAGIAERAQHYVKSNRLIRHGADTFLSAMFEVVAGGVGDQLADAHGPPYHGEALYPLLADRSLLPLLDERLSG